MAAPDNVRRLAKHRAEMTRAIADNISLDEARQRLAHDRWSASQQRLAAKCGTRAPDCQRDTVTPRFWWLEQDQ